MASVTGNDRPIAPLDPKKFRFVRVDYLIGMKMAVKYEEDDRIFVSPAVFELLKSDFSKVLAVLRVKTLIGKPILDGRVMFL